MLLIKHLQRRFRTINEEADMNYTLLNRDELPCGGNTYEFEGSQYDDTE